MTETRDTLTARLKALPMPDDIPGKRRAFAAKLGPQPAGEPLKLGGVETLVATPATDEALPTLLWFHGGGYVMGAPETHMRAAHHLAQGLRVMLPRYRLAPEHPWPAMLADGLAVFDALTGPVVLGGDSAGGHLALNIALARPGRAAGLALIAPNTDRRGLSRTRDSRADVMNDDATDTALAKLAMPDMAPEDPQVSPLAGDLAVLPPLHLEVAGNEVLLDDSLMLARAAAQAGTEVSLRVTPGLFHMFPLWPQVLPEAVTALDRLAAFARGCAAASAP